MDLHHDSALVTPPQKLLEKGDIRIDGDFSPELLFDFAELDGIWCIVGDEVKKARKERKRSADEWKAD